MSSPKSPPPRIDGFTYVEGIGGGGFADVFLFTQHSTGRGVAVKVLRAEHLSDHSLGQFETEARVMAGVSTHPYIVTIHDAGIATDGRPYLVMEHYPQPHFGRRAAGGHLPISEVLKVGVQVCSAVETAHRAGILHRDIKPANILTSAYGDPGLTDFGLAGVQSEEGLTSAAGVSYGFAAPEVVLDETATGSVSSDVYALGATTYALLSGRSPVHVPGGDNSTATLARRVASGEVQPLRREDLPRSLDHLLRSALSTRTQDRPSSAVDLAAALRDIEQELRLPPTPLVVTGGTAAASPTPSRVDPTGDATRRAPRVVHAHERPTPATNRGAGSPSAIAPTTASPVAHNPPSATRPDAATPESTMPDGATVARKIGRAGPVVPPPVGPEVTPADDATIARPRRGSTTSEEPPKPTGEATRADQEDQEAGVQRRKALAIGLGVAAIALVIVSVLFSRPGGRNDEAAPSTRPSTIPASTNLRVGAPQRVSVVTNPDGSLEVAWTPPEQDTAAAIKYMVFRSDLPDEETLATVQALSAQIPPGQEPNSGGTVCIKVQAQLGAEVANSNEVCTVGVPAAEPLEGETPTPNP